MAINVTVRLRRNERPEKLIRRFIKKCKKERIIETYKDKTAYYIKPGVRKKLKSEKARREAAKLQRKKRY